MNELNLESIYLILSPIIIVIGIGETIISIRNEILDYSEMAEGKGDNYEFVRYLPRVRK